MEHEWGWGQFNDWNSPALLGGGNRRPTHPESPQSERQLSACHMRSAKPARHLSRHRANVVREAWLILSHLQRLRCHTAGASATFGV